MTLALIPARANSKSIKNKNLALLGGKPLLYYTIAAAKQANCIDKILVSSDGEDILHYALSQDVATLKRPAKFAKDTTQTKQVLSHTLKHYGEYDEIIVLQATSPFRSGDDINRAYEIFKQKRANALISVSAIDNKILKAFLANKNGELEGINNNIFPFMPRQKLPKTYQSNGAIYIIKKEIFLRHNTFLPPKTHFYEMAQSLDIDTMQDLQRAEEILKGANDENSKCE